MNLSNALLSAIVSFRTYSMFLPHLSRRETLEETINRNMQMHLEKFGGMSKSLSKDIIKTFGYVHDLKAMPSMRGLQFAGEAIKKNNARQYNCSFLNIDNIRCFSEVLFLLLSGVGVGYSVQKRHVQKLPKIKNYIEEGTYVIHDSIMGWADAVERLFEAYTFERIRPIFDFSNIRPKGSYLVTTGAKAPGPEPLKKMLEQVEIRLKNARGRNLSSLEVHDIICIISDCVLAGGIRRAALISLFDRNDNEMLTCKSGEWWNKHPYRARANNSAVLPRHISKKEFEEIFEVTKNSGSGEPGFSWSDNMDIGTNPCVTGDTEILTKTGYKKIDKLIDKKITIWNGFEWSEVVPKITGKNQIILKINFSDGRELKCTPYHKFHLVTDYRGGQTISEAKDLKIGDKLIKNEFPVIEDGKEYVLDEMYTQGFYSADGVKNTNIIWLYEPKYCVEKFLVGRAVGKDLDNQFGTFRKHIKIEMELKEKEYVPFEANIKGRLAWLAGVLDGDGCELKEGGFQIGSVDRNFLLDIQKLLSTCGVNSKVISAMPEGNRSLPNGRGGYNDYYCREGFRICVGAECVQNLKSLGLNCKRLEFNKVPNRNASRFNQVVSIQELPGKESYVYCFNEPKRNLGCFNGVITGQCHEISLNSNQFCNLTTMNVTGVKNKSDFLKRCHAAALLGTLQAAYTDLPYLRPRWRETTEAEALLGCSMTGIADKGGKLPAAWLREGTKLILELNEKYAKKIGINPAARITAIKPEGSSSCVLGSSSGIHDRHSEYYFRRVRMNKEDALYRYLNSVIPDLCEDDLFSSSGGIVTIPQQSPNEAITRETTSAIDLLKRAMFFNKNWIHPGHRSGDNKNNVSLTVSVKENEWDKVCDFMYENRSFYSGISLLPFDGGSYQQAPFETIDKQTFLKYNAMIGKIDLKNVIEDDDYTNKTETIACSGGACDIL